VKHLQLETPATSATTFNNSELIAFPTNVLLSHYDTIVVGLCLSSWLDGKGRAKEQEMQYYVNADLVKEE
jgi:hypothetical protein